MLTDVGKAARTHRHGAALRRDVNQHTAMHPQSRIVGGSEISPHSLAFVASVWSWGRHTCGGTLLALATGWACQLVENALQAGF